MDPTPPQRRAPSPARSAGAASPPEAARPLAPAELVRRATTLSTLTGAPSSAQTRELSELLRHTTTRLEAGAPPEALAAASHTARLLAPLQARLSLPARFASKFAERFADLDRAIEARRTVVEAALRAAPPAMRRAATSPTPIAGLRPPTAESGLTRLAAPVTRASTAPEPTPSRRDARRANDALDLGGRQQARAQRRLDAEARRSEQHVNRAQARAEVAQRRLDRNTPATAERDRAAAAELAELEAAERRR